MENSITNLKHLISKFFNSCLLLYIINVKLQSCCSIEHFWIKNKL